MKFCLLIAVIVSAWIPSRSQNIPGEITWYKEVTQESIRALAVWDHRTVWFGASGSRYGYTADGGKNWQTGTIEEADGLGFRSVSVLGPDTVLLLTAGSPARLFKTTDAGKSWKMVFEDQRDAAFFDSMYFTDQQHGIAFGDPVEGCFYILVTRDGGDTWHPVPCRALPAASAGEAGFASSNTCIAGYKDHLWIATGGKTSRILHSADKGMTWEAFETPAAQGETMTGIYSIDFYNEHTGVFAGGNYEAPENNRASKGITYNGGRDWKLMSDGKDPGYLSCIQFIPGSMGKAMIAAGHAGLFLTKDQGETWENVTTGSFTTVRLTKDGKTAWFAGKGVLGKMQLKSGRFE